MKCRRCDYSLWTIRDRVCPECGAEFKPSDYDFVPSAVRFRCPHCAQPYYGTSHQGHLVPAEFDCVSCGRHVHMDEMVLEPAEGIDESIAVNRDLEIPWTRWRGRGFIGSWLKTVGWSLGRPFEIATRLPRRGGNLRAYWFAMFTLMVYTIIGALVPGLLFTLFMLAGRGGVRTAVAVMAFFALPTLFLGALWLLIWPLVIHLLLLMTGGCARSLGGTFKATCYTAATNVLVAVPCLSVYAGWVTFPWHATCLTLVIIKSHGVAVWRAILAVWLLPVLLSMAGFVGFMYFTSYSVRTSRAMLTNLQAQAGAVTVAGAVESWRLDGEWPPHAVDLIRDDPSLAAWFTPGDAPLADVPIGDTNLDDFLQLPGTEQDVIIDGLLADLGPNPAAHRLGTVVCAWHGIPTDAPGVRWIAVVCDPKPDGPDYFVIRLDGSVQAYEAPEDFEPALESENDRRERAKLPSLPRDIFLKASP